MNQRVLIASDHGGIDLKKQIVDFLKSKKVEVVDLGPHEKVSVNYCLYSRKIVQEIKEEDKGIAICSTGLGISFGVIKGGIKCSFAFNQYTARDCRQLGMQVMAMGQKVVTPTIAIKMVQQFLNIK